MLRVSIPGTSQLSNLNLKEKSRSNSVERNLSQTNYRINPINYRKTVEKIWTGQYEIYTENIYCISKKKLN